MTVPLRSGVSGWVAEENGVRFTLAPIGPEPAGPHLIENRTYQLVVEAPPGLNEASLSIGGVSVDMVPSTWRGTVLVQTLVLRHEFGNLRIRLSKGAALLAECVAEVRPRYLDAETDILNMKRDIQEISTSLAYSVWKNTFRTMYPDLSVSATGPEWLSILRALWHRLLVTLREIERDPHQALVARRVVVPVDRAGKIDNRSVRWLSKNPAAWAKVARPGRRASVPYQGEHAVPTEVSVPRREVTYDTPPNRVLKKRLRALNARIAGAVETVSEIPKGHFAYGRKIDFRNHLQELSVDLAKATGAKYLQSVGAPDAYSPASIHVMRADPRYREVLRITNLLDWGLTTTVKGRAVEASLRQTWELYEFWVFLYVLKWFDTECWECIEQGVLRIDNPAKPILRVDMERGVETQTTFQRRDLASGTVSRVELTFHASFPCHPQVDDDPVLGSMTADRDVDILLRVQHGVEPASLFALDPKYRVMDEGACRICPSAAVDDMHVYRDDIVLWSMLPGSGVLEVERALDGAYAVFPAVDDPCHRLHRFITGWENGVGAAPLAPGTANPTSGSILNELLQLIAYRS